MARILMGVFAMTAALVLAQAAQAQDPSPKQTDKAQKKSDDETTDKQTDKKQKKSEDGTTDKKTDKLQKRIPVGGAILRDVEVNGRKLGTIAIAPNGRSNVVTLGSGHRVSVLMRNGLAQSALVVNRLGGAVPAQVRNDVAARTIIIIIRDGGTVIIIIIRTRVV
jgi:hypothetical protein